MEEEMKKLTKMIAVFLAAMLFTGNALAKDDNTRIVENNLMMGIESNNEGLVISSAHFLGELESDRAVIKLMSLTRAGNSDEVRIAAATALSQIGSSKGMYQIKEMTKENMSDELRAEFNRLWFEYSTNS